MWIIISYSVVHVLSVLISEFGNEQCDLDSRGIKKHIAVVKLWYWELVFVHSYLGNYCYYSVTTAPVSLKLFSLFKYLHSKYIIYLIYFPMYYLWMTEQINWILKTTVVQLPEIVFTVEFLGIGIKMQDLLNSDFLELATD